MLGSVDELNYDSSFFGIGSGTECIFIRTLHSMQKWCFLSIICRLTWILVNDISLTRFNPTQAYHGVFYLHHRPCKIISINEIELIFPNLKLSPRRTQRLPTDRNTLLKLKRETGAKQQPLLPARKMNREIESP